MRLRDTGYVVQDAQAGRNVIECLLRYLDKGGYWTDNASLKQVAIGIMRKVSACHNIVHAASLLLLICYTVHSCLCLCCPQRVQSFVSLEERAVYSSLIKGSLMAQAAMPCSLGMHIQMISAEASQHPSHDHLTLVLGCKIAWCVSMAVLVSLW